MHLIIQLDFANTRRYLPPNLREGINNKEDVFSALIGSLVGSLIYKGSRASACLTPLKQKLKTLILTLPNIKGDYNIKEIIRNKLNKRTNIQTCFLKQSCNYIIPKDQLAIFEDLKFKMTSFKKYRKSLLQPFFQIENSGNLPCLKHYKAIFKRFKLRPLYSLNLKVYIYILLKILYITLT